MSPRKSSTSSANPSLRPRYLGLEVAGVPPFPIRGWIERELGRRLPPEGGRPLPRVIRWEGHRGLVRIDALDVARARQVWNGEIEAPGSGRIRLATTRTWGTLRKGKAWLADASAPNGPPDAERE